MIRTPASCLALLLLCCVSTDPLKVTTPFTVSTLICSVLRPGSAKMAALTLVVIAASSMATPAFAPCSLMLSPTFSVAWSIFLPAVSAGPGLLHAPRMTTKWLAISCQTTTAKSLVIREPQFGLFQYKTGSTGTMAICHTTAALSQFRSRCSVR